MIPPHLIRAAQAVTVYERCDTCDHTWHGAHCRGHQCMCRGPFAGIPEAWLPVKTESVDLQVNQGDQ